MPLTFAHPLAVVPLRRLGLPFSALAVGAMVPDAPLLAPWLPWGYDAAHAPAGLVTVDLLAGVLLWVVWRVLLRAPLVDAAPAPIRDRVPTPFAPRGARLPLVPAAVVVGAVTHVVWDAFTHPGRWGARLVPWLTETHAGMPGAKWAQYVSGVGGVVVLAVIAVVVLRRTPARPAARRRPRLAPWVIRAPAVVGLASALVVTSLGWAFLPSHDLAYAVVTRGVAAAVGVWVVTSLVWRWAPDSRRRSATG